MKKLIILLSLVSVIGLGTAPILCAWTYPSDPCPIPMADWPSGTDYSVATGCACQNATLTPPAASDEDWLQDDPNQTLLWDWWRNGETGWTKYDNATHAYNCHSYVFNDSDDWLDDPSPFIGSDPSTCWTNDSSGGYLNNAEHSCTTGYKGKCGLMFLQSDNDDIYNMTGATTYKKP